MQQWGVINVEMIKERGLAQRYHDSVAEGREGRYCL